MSIIGSASERRSYSEGELKAHAHKALGRPFELEILSVLPWVRMELVAERYHEGRVFLAGDACHLTSPTGGLGMNTGIGDAVDLGWKLAALLEGWGGPALAESYGIERKPIAERITRFSTGNLQTMLSARSSEKLFEDSDEGRATRARVGHALSEGMKREWFCMNMHLGYRYVDSPICIYDEPESREQIAAEYADGMSYRPSTRPGCRAPHAWLADGRSTLDLFGRGFVLLAFGDVHDPFVKTIRIDEPQVKALYEKRYVLVRPDGHVAWRGDTIPEDPAAILAVAEGRTRALVAP
jgi:hypothetical protein